MSGPRVSWVGQVARPEGPNQVATGQVRSIGLRSDEFLAVRSGFLAERSESIRVVTDWIRLVVGFQWSLTDAEAVQQDVLTELVTLGRAGRIRTDTDFRVFVFRVARLRAIDAYRSQRLRRHAPLPEPFEARDERAESGSSRLIRRERVELAKFILQTLTPACRELLRWLLGEERSHAWIAQRLEISEGAARVRAHRCIERARRISKRFAPALGGLSHER